MAAVWSSNIRAALVPRAACTPSRESALDNVGHGVVWFCGSPATSWNLRDRGLAAGGDPRPLISALCAWQLGSTEARREGMLLTTPAFLGLTLLRLLASSCRSGGVCSSANPLASGEACVMSTGAPGLRRERVRGPEDAAMDGAWTLCARAPDAACAARHPPRPTPDRLSNEPVPNSPSTHPPSFRSLHAAQPARSAASPAASLRRLRMLCGAAVRGRSGATSCRKRFVHSQKSMTIAGLVEGKTAPLDPSQAPVHRAVMRSYPEVA